MNKMKLGLGLKLISEGIAMLADACVEGNFTATTAPIETATATTAPKEEKTKKTKAKKEEPQATQAPAPEPVQQELDVFSETPAAATAQAELTEKAKEVSAPVQSPITEDVLRDKLVAFSQKHGKEKAYAVLAKYDGAKRVNELSPAQLPQVFNELQAGL